jgi:membrane-bound metal-dependent hydrolase YbcI (DUF457 family)
LVKTGFAEHIILSILAVAPAFLLLPPSPFLAWALALFLIGSIAPDIDHPRSIPRKAAVLSGFLVLFSALFLTSTLASGCAEPGCLLLLALVSLALSIALLELLSRMVPRHRGKFHSSKAGLFFGVLVFISLGLSLSRADALALGLFASAGYMFHLLVDFLGDRL